MRFLLIIYPVLARSFFKWANRLFNFPFIFSDQLVSYSMLCRDLAELLLDLRVEFSDLLTEQYEQMLRS